MQLWIGIILFINILVLVLIAPGIKENYDYWKEHRNKDPYEDDETLP